ncbi:hypothetical protein PIB30_049005 [Stylosanthes scabra]|uniref:Uncharacterized protein n=1 Tax=Stylosanthes scabra TaxID=79078 RepID=A0ABU6ZG04_9FABA|nr:hypothetical protein [Stylosanthes scabra]
MSLTWPKRDPPRPKARKASPSSPSTTFLSRFLARPNVTSLKQHHNPSKSTHARPHLDQVPDLAQTWFTSSRPMICRFFSLSVNVALKEKEIGLPKEENEGLKNEVARSGKDKKDLEDMVVELCVEKKELEYDKIDPVNVVYKGELIDDDQVLVEGSDDNNLAE